MYVCHCWKHEPRRDVPLPLLPPFTLSETFHGWQPLSSPQAYSSRSLPPPVCALLSCAGRQTSFSLGSNNVSVRFHTEWCQPRGLASTDSSPRAAAPDGWQTGMPPGPSHLLQLRDRERATGIGAYWPRFALTPISCNVLWVFEESGFGVIGVCLYSFVSAVRAMVWLLVMHHLIMANASAAGCLMTSIGGGALLAGERSVVMGMVCGPVLLCCGEPAKGARLPTT